MLMNCGYFMLLQLLFSVVLFSLIANVFEKKREACVRYTVLAVYIFLSVQRICHVFRDTDVFCALPLCTFI